MNSRPYINIDSSHSTSPSGSATSVGRSTGTLTSHDIGTHSPGSRGSGSFSPWSADTSMISGGSSPGTPPLTGCVRYQATSSHTVPDRPVSLSINSARGTGSAGGQERHGGRINLALTDTDSSRCSSVSNINNSTTTLSTTSRLLPPRPSTDKPPESYLFLALVVAFFFNLPFGIIATCVSLRARKETEKGAERCAERLATISLVISLLGILVSALAIGLTIYFVIHNH